MLLKLIVPDPDVVAHSDTRDNWTPCEATGTNVFGTQVMIDGITTVETGIVEIQFDKFDPQYADPRAQALVAAFEAVGNEGPYLNLVELFGRGEYEPDWKKGATVFWIKAWGSLSDPTLYLHTGWAFICDDAGQTRETVGPFPIRGATPAGYDD